MSKVLGIVSSISLHLSLIISYGLSPSPPYVLGNKLKIVSHYLLVKFILLVIYAVLCIPNIFILIFTSGSSFIGKLLIYSFYESKLLSIGQ